MAKFYQTLQTTLESHKGVGPGFDLLRIGLAVAIFYGHAKYVSGASVSPAAVADALVQKGVDIETARAAAFDWSFWGSFKRDPRAVTVFHRPGLLPILWKYLRFRRPVFATSVRDESSFFNR